MVFPVVEAENPRPPFETVPLMVSEFLCVMVRVPPVRSTGPEKIVAWPPNEFPPVPIPPPPPAIKLPPIDTLFASVVVPPFDEIAPPLMTSAPVPRALLCPSPSVPDVSVVPPEYEFDASRSTVPLAMLTETPTTAPPAP